MNQKNLDKIENYLTKIEQDRDVEILYACEAGSRAWGFESEDSDFDVRFIYKRPLEWYLQAVGAKKDTIDFIEDDYDFAGWDILKALRLAAKTNPSLMEWLYSPILYKVSKFSTQLNIIMSDYNKSNLIMHYGSLAKRTWKDYLENEDALLKKYFYALRPTLNILYMQQNDIYPPVHFPTMLKHLKLDMELKHEIKSLLAKKKESKESTLNDLQIPLVRQFILHWIDEYKVMAKHYNRNNPNTNKLNQLGVVTINKNQFYTCM